MSFDEVGISLSQHFRLLYISALNIFNASFGPNIFPSTKRGESRWMESFCLDTINTIGHLVIFNHLYLKPHVGPRQTNTTSLLKPSVRWRSCISHCLSSHISVRAYPCSVGNIKTPYFILPIQSHIYNFPKPKSVKENRCGTCDVTPP